VRVLSHHRSQGTHRQRAHKIVAVVVVMVAVAVVIVVDMVEVVVRVVGILEAVHQQ
jgi:hypothetical protein